MAAASVQYNGHILTPATKYQPKRKGWSLEVHIKPIGRTLGGRRCRAKKNLYATEEKATERCLEFGRQIVDGVIQPKKK